MKLKHPHLHDVEKDVPSDRVAAFERAGWVRKNKRVKRAEPIEAVATGEAEVIEESKDG